MNASHTVLAASVLAASCAAGGHLDLGIAEPRWSQRPDEALRLPVGRVLAVQRVDAGVAPPLTQPGAAAMGSQIGVQVDVQALARTSGAKGTSVYRHSLRLRSGQLQAVDAEYRFSVGDCVALRARLQPDARPPQLVVALPDACD